MFHPCFPVCTFSFHKLETLLDSLPLAGHEDAIGTPSEGIPSCKPKFILRAELDTMGTLVLEGKPSCKYEFLLGPELEGR